MSRASTVLLYGETGTGKTAQLGRLARWHFDQTGEISRLISADSGWDSIDAGDLWSLDNPQGIIEPWSVQGLQDPWATLVAATEGSWPEVYQAPSGEFKIRMKKSTLRDGRILGAGDRIVGQYFWEGLSTLGNTGLQDHIRTGRIIGQDVVGKFTSTVDEQTGAGPGVSRSVTFAKAAPSHYGHTQDFVLLKLVPDSGRMPLVRVVWTAHEAKGTDDITGIKDSVLGPAIVGKATVNKTVEKFGHSLHLTAETRIEEVKGKPAVIVDDFRAWFVKHPDAILNRMFWPTKTSLTIPQGQELRKKFPGGYLPLTLAVGIEQYMDFLGSLGESK